MILPDQYSWLANETGPRILREALKLYGTAETPGPASNPEILKWAVEVGAKRLGIQYKDDAVAWCGLFMAVCAKRAGLDLPAIPVRALSWVNYGTPVAKPMLGDILVFTRKGGGHVGLYVGEDDEAFHVLGGNQSDRVCITRIDKDRLTATRRTIWKVAQPNNVRQIRLARGGNLSHNEA